ncbi:outer membrane beta-barrel protein [Marinobacter sp. CHS3-4]|uniref:outer membrane beta-barrel protein n=1 Tax=Marinobacter sp. CHS3-4 TaxID=3045174 RepID=UPI0024B568E7|nr:outer membrane beta-barrel protein [Marinobacter sp. CHS3-4]MDI9245955.1 outer membrane beta-barrel protein [Marinobacter sp. CHS3-4]
MFSRKITIGLASVALLGAMNANAELLKGDTEISGSLSIQETETDFSDSETTFLLFTGGQMLTDNLQGILGISMFESEGFTSGQFTFGADYLFSPRSELIPYVGGSYALSFGDQDDTDFLQLKGGVKTFISETTSVFGEYRRLEAVDSDFDITISTLAVGLSVKF